MVVHTCNPSYSGSEDRRITRARLAKAKLARPYPKHKIKTKGLGA
jgi:hypothetical protein